jgi:2-polyprenyl-3-methyl-5-hydroxy-6-metoxy-1,4-benzoquinol methylase
MIKTLLKQLHAPIYEKRLECLSGLILAHLKQNDKVLDVGCGGGALGASLIKEPGAPLGLIVEGLENHPRGGEPIRVHQYAGGKFPFADKSYDVVCLLDVLHHDQDIASVLQEAA